MHCKQLGLCHALAVQEQLSSGTGAFGRENVLYIVFINTQETELWL